MNKEVETPQRRWIFPSPVQCPRCKQYDTEATHTDSQRGVQYRKCRRATCRRKFSVDGTPVADPHPAAPPVADPHPAAPPVADPHPAVPPVAAILCPHCGKDYQRQGDLTKHIQKTHQKGETNDG